MTKKNKKRLIQQKEYVAKTQYLPPVEAFPELKILDKFLSLTDQDLSQGAYFYAAAPASAPDHMLGVWSKSDCPAPMLEAFLSEPINEQETRLQLLFKKERHLKIFYEEILAPQAIDKKLYHKIRRAMSHAKLSSQNNLNFEQLLQSNYNPLSYTVQQNLFTYALLNPEYKKEFDKQNGSWAEQELHYRTFWERTVGMDDVLKSLVNHIRRSAMTCALKLKWCEEEKNQETRTIKMREPIEVFKVAYQNFLNTPDIQDARQNKPFMDFVIASWVFHVQDLNRFTHNFLCRHLEAELPLQGDLATLQYTLYHNKDPVATGGHLKHAGFYPQFAATLDFIQKNNIVREKIMLEETLQDIEPPIVLAKKFKI